MATVINYESKKSIKIYSCPKYFLSFNQVNDFRHLCGNNRVWCIRLSFLKRFGLPEFSLGSFYIIKWNNFLVFYTFLIKFLTVSECSWSFILKNLVFPECSICKKFLHMCSKNCLSAVFYIYFFLVLGLNKSRNLYGLSCKQLQCLTSFLARPP